MKPLFLIACLCAASPAFGQTKVYTNADLGHPLSPNRGTVTPEQLASLAAHQFRMPQTFDGPRMVSAGSSPTAGPFGDVQNTIVPRRLDGSLWTDPPWQSVAYAPGYYVPYVPPVPYVSGGRDHSGRSGGARRHGAARRR